MEEYPSRNSFVNRHPSLNKPLSNLQRQKGHVKVFCDGRCWDLRGNESRCNDLSETESSRYPILIRRAEVIWEALSEIADEFYSRGDDDEECTSNIPVDLSVADFIEKHMISESKEDIEIVKSIVDSMYARTAGTNIQSYGVNEASREEWCWDYTESNWRTKGCFSELILHYLDTIDSINNQVEAGDGMVTINLVLNCPIDSVDSVAVGNSNISKVKVSPKSTTSINCFLCDKVIIAVPLGVLKADKISFNGEFSLPTVKQFAIDTINMFSGMKCHVLLRKGVDIMENADIVELTELFFCAGEIFSQVWMRRNENSVFVTGFVVAENRDELKKRIDDGESAEAMFLNQLKQMLVSQRDCTVFLDENEPTCSAFTLHDWSEDEYIMGMYSSPSVGGGWQRGASINEEDMHTSASTGQQKVVAQTCRHYLARPIKDYIFFAGEHTNIKTCATVQAALESGITAARETLSAIKSLK